MDYYKYKPLKKNRPLATGYVFQVDNQLPWPHHPAARKLQKSILM